MEMSIHLVSQHTSARESFSGKRLVFSMIALLGTFSIIPRSFAKAACSYDRLMKLPGFEDEDYEQNTKNPGKLKAYYYKPDGLPSNAPLVVALEDTVRHRTSTYLNNRI